VNDQYPWRNRFGGLPTMLGWRFGLAAAAGIVAAVVLGAARGSAGRSALGLGAVVAVPIVVGLLWEVATQRARCGFKPLG
jgi:hypothetical protein